MTDDLVKRLRDGPGIDGFETWDLLQEAADCINELWARKEVLEKALRQVVGILDDPTGGQHVADMRSAASVARAALEGKR
jgi:hypothetical protein